MMPHDKVDWNELLVRESIPDDYGTIRVTETHRERNAALQEQNDSIVKDFN